MSSEILKNGKEILQCSSAIFDLIYCNFSNIFYSKPLLTENQEISRFMEYMEIYNSNGGSYWFDIAKYIKESRNVKLLIEMLEETLVKVDSTINNDVKKNLLDFHGELVKYKEELESQGK